MFSLRHFDAADVSSPAPSSAYIISFDSRRRHYASIATIRCHIAAIADDAARLMSARLIRRQLITPLSHY
jgi:hypothetical protein